MVECDDVDSRFIYFLHLYFVYVVRTSYVPRSSIFDFLNLNSLLYSFKKTRSACRGYITSHRDKIYVHNFMGGRSSTSNVNKRRSSNNNADNENERMNEQEQERRTLLVRRRLNDITCTADNDEQQQQQQQHSPSSCFRINLSLLDVSNEVRYDPDANHLRNLLQQHLQKNNAYSATTILSTTTDFNKETATATSISTTVDTVQKKILRFLKTQDKYTSFVSLLLKSQAFYEIYDDENNIDIIDNDNDNDNDNNDFYNNAKSDDDDDEQNQTHIQIQRQRQRRPVIDLPRTKYKKPYIPLPNDYWSSSSSSSSRMYDNKSDESTVKVICATNTNDDNNNNNNNESNNNNNESNSRIQEEDVFSFSISHQFPFVGMAQIAMHHHDGDHDNDNDNDDKQIMTPLAAKAIIVGLDIVTFDDAIIKRLYSNSLNEFLNVFRDSFTNNEWNIGIQDPTLLSNNNNRLKEFYIRWSMKEAYTKAIGIGMGLEFNSFEICLQEDKEIIDDDDNDDDNDNGNNQNNTSMKSVWNRIVVSQQQQQQRDNNSSSSNNDNNNNNDSDSVTTPTISRPTCFHGRIRSLNNNIDKDDEFFLFYFLPLRATKRNMSSSSSTTTTTTKVQEGYACVCVGSPFHGKKYNTASSLVGDNNNTSSREWRNCINISWTELDTLLGHYH